MTYYWILLSLSNLKRINQLCWMNTSVSDVLFILFVIYTLYPEKFLYHVLLFWLTVTALAVSKCLAYLSNARTPNHEENSILNVIIPKWRLFCALPDSIKSLFIQAKTYFLLEWFYYSFAYIIIRRDSTKRFYCF